MSESSRAFTGVGQFHPHPKAHAHSKPWTASHGSSGLCYVTLCLVLTFIVFYNSFPSCFAALISSLKNADWKGFPGGAVVENLLADAGDTGSSPGLGRSHMPQSN